MAAEASFNTEIDSMSLELILSQPETPCIPSTTTNGLLSPVVLRPRIIMRGLSLPGSPVVIFVITPVINPPIALDTLREGLAFSSFAATLVTEPVKVDLRCVPYPTTTTSSRFCDSDTRAASITDLPAKGTSMVPYPINENTNTGFWPDTASEYFPLASVMVPIVVPLTTMFTPGIASPV